MIFYFTDFCIQTIINGMMVYTVARLWQHESAIGEESFPFEQNLALNKNVINTLIVAAIIQVVFWPIVFMIINLFLGLKNIRELFSNNGQVSCLKKCSHFIRLLLLSIAIMIGGQNLTFLIIGGMPTLKIKYGILFSEIKYGFAPIV